MESFNVSVFSWLITLSLHSDWNIKHKYETIVEKSNLCVIFNPVEITREASSVFPSSDGKAREADGKAREVAINPCTVHSTVQKCLQLFVYSECL